MNKTRSSARPKKTLDAAASVARSEGASAGAAQVRTGDQSDLEDPAVQVLRRFGLDPDRADRIHRGMACEIAGLDAENDSCERVSAR